MKNKMLPLVLFSAVAGFFAPVTAQIVMNSSTEYWAAIQYPNNNIPDPFFDQQTGSYESDIVGDSNHAALYTSFYGGGTPSLTDGQLAFRFRMAGEKNPTGYTGAVFVGLDANLDGALDIFIGVNNSGSSDQVGIWYAGSGANISPSTTTLDTMSPYYTSSLSSANYDWSILSTTIDPDAQTLDVDAGPQSGTDYFVSFSVPFTELIGAFDAISISNITENSAMTYVSASATQANSLNQDLGGVDGGVNSGDTWEVLGATSNVTSPNQTVPEPATFSLLGFAFAGGYLFRSIRRYNRSFSAYK